MGSLAEIIPQLRDRLPDVAPAVDALRAGLLVGVPTETVYGVAADASNPDAVARIFAAKQRPASNPLIVHTASSDDAGRLGNLGKRGEYLAEAFWPGALTIVAERIGEGRITDLVTAGLATIAIRVPAHPVMQALLIDFGSPIAAPSANRSGRISATAAEHVAADLGSDVAVILDAGPAPLGLESTIVSVVDTPRLLRPGAIVPEAIEEALGMRLAIAGRSELPEAPGMLSSHYAPSVPLRINAAAVRKGESLLAFGSNLPVGAATAVSIVNLSAEGDLVEAAANLFSSLRRLDQIGVPIAVAPIPANGLGLAINDRLRRASAPRQL